MNLDRCAGIICMKQSLSFTWTCLGQPGPGIEDMVGADGGVDFPLHAVLQPAAVVRDVDEHAEGPVVHIRCHGHCCIGRTCGAEEFLTLHHVQVLRNLEEPAFS